MLRTAITIMLIALWSLQASAQMPPPQSDELSLLQAVRQALLNHPLLKSQLAQVEIARGGREQAAGAFDLTFQGNSGGQLQTTPLTEAQIDQNLLSGNGSPVQRADFTDSGISLSKKFHNGISVSPQLSLNRATDNIFTTNGVNTSTFSLRITLPLLRGRGRTTAAQEDAAKAEVAVNLLNLNQLISQLMLNVANSYWNLVAARENLAIAVDAENRGHAYLENVEALVTADHVPRNDLNEARANLAQRVSTRISAEQQVKTAQNQLSLDMGETAEGLMSNHLVPSDDFPEGNEQKTPAMDSASLQYYLQEALQHRGDYLAARKRIHESEILQAAARNQLLPQLDLGLSSGYSGLQEGRTLNNFFAASGLGARGPNAALGLTYTFPGRNQTAKGAARQADATVRQSAFQSDEIARNISLGVAVAADAVGSAISRLKNARESVRSYESALAGEREKYKGGMGSIVSILTVEDKLNTAQADQIQAQLAYAVALVQFRFATGTLASSDQSAQSIQADTFLTLPFFEFSKTR